MIRRVAPVLLGLLLAGCASEKYIGRPGVQAVSNGELPAPGRGDLILQQRSYLVGPLDRVTVDVYNVPELTRTVQVDASGQLVLPLIGPLQAAGKTSEEVSAAVASALRGRYVRDPKVTVSIESTSQVVTVDGQVQHPGLYPVIGRMTLIRAVASAQGLNDNASQNHVVVYRRVNGHEMAGLYDLRAIRAGYYADPEVYANDVIYVGESGGRRAFQLLVQSGGLLVGPLIAILN